LNEVGVKLKEDGSYINRFDGILNANPDLLFFKDFNTYKSRPTEKHFSFIPLTTVDVENVLVIIGLFFLKEGNVYRLRILRYC
jgi:hypothetical protein